MDEVCQKSVLKQHVYRNNYNDYKRAVAIADFPSTGALKA